MKQHFIKISTIVLFSIILSVSCKTSPDEPKSTTPTGENITAPTTPNSDSEQFITGSELNALLADSKITSNKSLITEMLNGNDKVIALENCNNWTNEESVELLESYNKQITTDDYSSQSNQSFMNINGSNAWMNEYNAQNLLINKGAKLTFGQTVTNGKGKGVQKFIINSKLGEETIESKGEEIAVDFSLNDSNFIKPPFNFTVGEKTYSYYPYLEEEQAANYIHNDDEKKLYFLCDVLYNKFYKYADGLTQKRIEKTTYSYDNKLVSEKGTENKYYFNGSKIEYRYSDDTSTSHRTTQTILKDFKISNENGTFLFKLDANFVKDNATDQYEEGGYIKVDVGNGYKKVDVQSFMNAIRL